MVLQNFSEMFGIFKKYLILVSHLRIKLKNCLIVFPQTKTIDFEVTGPSRIFSEGAGFLRTYFSILLGALEKISAHVCVSRIRRSEFDGLFIVIV